MKTEAHNLSEHRLLNDPAKFFRDLLIERKSKNASYSIRALARDLEISPAFLSQVMNGKRNLSLEQKMKIKSMLGLSTSPKNASPAMELIHQTVEHEKILKHWYHFAILELAQISKLENSPVKIGKRLGVSAVEIQAAIERLIEFGYIEKQKNILVRTIAPFMFNSKTSSHALRSLHKNRLIAAHDELENYDSASVDKRYFQTLFLPTTEKKAAEAKKIMGKFQQKLIAFLKDENPDEIFQLSIQLFSAEERSKSKEEA